MKFILVLLAVAAAVVVWLQAGKRSSRAAPRRAAPTAAIASHTSATQPWRATSIVTGEAPCAAVLAIGNRRFLDSERSVPRLPVPGCDAAKCNCRYQRHEDRRKDNEDRRHPAALHTELYESSGNNERRRGRRGRRKTDWS